MIDYKTLKHSENGMPTWDGWCYPILLVANQKEVWKLKDLISAVLKEVPLPKELAELRYDSKYHDLVAQNRISWAKSELKTIGFLNAVERGVYEITPAGRDALKKYGADLTAEVIHKLPAYIAHQKKAEEKKNTEVAPDDGKDLDPAELTEEKIQKWFDTQRKDLRKALLNKLRKVDPYVFEHMMVQLLSTMGYKGTNGESLVTQKSNDGGIDGIINQDPLGLQKISIQVKRYGANNVVGRPEIDAFYGALHRQGTERGVFITTSSFSEGARKTADAFHISLVDGEMLTNLMIQYQVGVQSKKTFELYQIDNDFFSNEE